MSADRSTIRQNYQKVISSIEGECATLGRQSPKIIAVSKTRSYSDIEALYILGHRDFGENYIQELSEKAQQAQNSGLSEIRWHFIGHLQSKKSKTCAKLCEAIHSLDSLKLAEKLNSTCEELSKKNLQVYIQIKLAQSMQKSGISPDALPEVLEKLQVFGNLRLMGLMCIPDPGETKTIEAYTTIQNLSLNQMPPDSKDLSIGMTSDFKLALRFGTSALRIGEAIFGTRNV